MPATGYKNIALQVENFAGGGVSNTYQITYQIDTEGQHAKQMS